MTPPTDPTSPATVGTFLTVHFRNWQEGTRTPVARLLAEHPELLDNPEGLLQLIDQELVLLRLTGETPSATEYLAAFPELPASLAEQVRFLLLLPQPDSPPVTAPPGYEIDGELGRGHFGIVYLARQKGLQRVCALKMILQGALSSEEQRRRFEVEGQAAARISHPNIVQVYEFGIAQDPPFLAMEYCARGTLRNRLRTGPLVPHQAAVLVRDLARGIAAAHAKQVLHRDLKPDNILLTEDGTPKISDFGLAKKLDDHGLTQSGTILGTPAYMPPEQARGDRNQGPPCDIYALGAILYECLTGRPPFVAATAMETLLQVLDTEPVPPRRLNPKLPIDLETIALKCLQKKPSHRYADAEALAEDLERFLENRPIQARPLGFPTRVWRLCRRHPLSSGLLAMLLLVILSSLAWTGYTLRQTQHLLAQVSESEAAMQSVLNEFVIEEVLDSGGPGKHENCVARIDHWTQRARTRFAGEQQRRLLSTTLNFLSNAYLQVGQVVPAVKSACDQRAGAVLREVLDLREAHHGADHPATLQSRGNWLLFQSETPESAGWGQTAPEFERLYRRSCALLGDSHSDTLTAHHNWATALYLAGDYERALPESRQCLEDRIRIQGEGYPQVFVTRDVLGFILLSLDRTREAEREFQSNYEHAAARLGPDHPNTLSTAFYLGRTRLANGKAAQAADTFGTVLAMSPRWGTPRPSRDTVLLYRGWALLDAGKPEEASPLLSEARDQRSQQPGIKAWRVHYPNLLAQVAQAERGNFASVENHLKDSYRVLLEGLHDDPDNLRILLPLVLQSWTRIDRLLVRYSTPDRLAAWRTTFPRPPELLLRKEAQLVPDPM